MDTIKFKSQCLVPIRPLGNFANILFLFCTLTLTLNGTISLAQQHHITAGSWGDQLNGTFKNPVINADYSDPDVIRVGEYYYMVCSDFHFMGMPVLRSKDMVNWTIISQVYSRLDIHPGYDNMDKYGAGSWAPTLRYHDKKFYIYFCTPDEGLYMSTSADPTKGWAPLHEVKRTSGWEDPCPFWDEDGQAYLGHSRLGGGPIIIHRMNPEGTKLLDEGKTVYEGPTAEGTKIYKRNGFYYVIIPEGGVSTGYQTALRSRSIYGPYERKIVLEQGNTTINGPHQGGLVEAKDGKWWFMHFQAKGALGRVVHLQPVKWVADWPIMGEDLDGNGIGEPVGTWSKPRQLEKPLSTAIQTNDEFNQTHLGLQWQWNHNPFKELWSLSRFKGYLALEASASSEPKKARNTLTQKLMGDIGVVSTLMKINLLEDGQRAGLCLIGGNIFEIGITKTDGKPRIYADHNGVTSYGPYLSGDRLHLRASINLIANQTFLYYSIDGKEFKQLGGPCELSGSNHWKAVRPALFSYNIQRKAGTALFDRFHYQYDGTGGGMPGEK